MIAISHSAPSFSKSVAFLTTKMVNNAAITLECFKHFHGLNARMTTNCWIFALSCSAGAQANTFFERLNVTMVFLHHVPCVIRLRLQAMEEIQVKFGH